MNCQSLVSGKNEKKIVTFLFAESIQRVVKVNELYHLRIWDESHMRQ